MPNKRGGVPNKRRGGSLEFQNFNKRGVQIKSGGGDDFLVHFNGTGRRNLKMNLTNGEDQYLATF